MNSTFCDGEWFPGKLRGRLEFRSLPPHAMGVFPFHHQGRGFFCWLLARSGRETILLPCTIILPRTAGPRPGPKCCSIRPSSTSIPARSGPLPRRCVRPGDGAASPAGGGTDGLPAPAGRRRCLWQARERLATFLGGDPRTASVHGQRLRPINIVAASLRLAAPGEILLTDHEYGAMHWCWERAAQRQGLTLRTFPLPVLTEDPREIVDAACAAMTDRTRLFFFSHVLSPTGLVLPGPGVVCRGAATRHPDRGRRRPRPGDAPAQPGRDSAVDFYGATVTSGCSRRPDPASCTWGRGVRTLIQPHAGELGLAPRARPASTSRTSGARRRASGPGVEGTAISARGWRFRPPSTSRPGSAGSAFAAAFAELARYVRQRLGDELGLPFATPASPELCGSLTAFRLPVGTDPKRLRRGLWERHRIEIPIVERPDRLLIRVSTHFYNTEAEIDRLTSVLPELLRVSAGGGEAP